MFHITYMYTHYIFKSVDQDVKYIPLSITDRNKTVSGTVPARNNVGSVQSRKFLVPEPEHAKHFLRS